MSVLDNAISWFQSAYTSAGDTVSAWSQEWQNSVNVFKTKAKQFVADYNALRAMASTANSDPELKKQYDSLMSKGGWIYSAIQGIATKIDFTNNNGGVGAMGVIPLVPIAVIAGSIAAMTAWLSEAYIVKQKLMAIQAAQEGNHSLSDYGDILGTDGTSTGGMIQKAVIFGALGFALYKFMPKIKELFNV